MRNALLNNKVDITERVISARGFKDTEHGTIPKVYSTCKQASNAIASQACFVVSFSADDPHRLACVMEERNEAHNYPY